MKIKVQTDGEAIDVRKMAKRNPKIGIGSEDLKIVDKEGLEKFIHAKTVEKPFWRSLAKSEPKKEVDEAPYT